MNNVIWLLASQIIDPMLRSTMKILSKFSVFSLLWIVLLYTRQVLSGMHHDFLYCAILALIYSLFSLSLAIKDRPGRYRFAPPYL